MRQDQSNNLPRSCRTTSGAQSTLPFTTGFYAGGLLLEEWWYGLNHRFQNRDPLPSCGKSHAYEYIKRWQTAIFRPFDESLGLCPSWWSRKIARLHQKGVFVGWETSFECTCVIGTSSRTSIARPYGRHLRRSWTLSVHFLLIYFDSASCPRGLLVMTATWVYTRTTWTKSGPIQVMYSLIL
jgi:hypothetical protein